MAHNPTAWTSPAYWFDTIGPRPLVMLTTSYPSPANPIAGHFVHDLARTLVQQGHEVTVLTPASKRAPVVEEEREGVRLVRVGSLLDAYAPFHSDGLPELLEAPLTQQLTSLHRFAAIPCSLFSLAVYTARFLENQPPIQRARTHLIGHWLVPSGMLAQLLAIYAGISATTLCHSAGVRLVARLPRFVASPLVRFSLGSSPCIVTCTELVHLLEGVLQGSLPSQPLIAPMPAAPLRRIADPPPGPPFHLLTLARLVPVKNLDAFARALKDAPFPYVWHICGEGPMRRELEALCETLGIHVRFHGLVTGLGKERILSQAHALVLPSKVAKNGRTEGSPVVLREAIEYTLPILATRVGGVPDALRGYSHAVLAAPHSASLCCALTTLHQHMNARWRVADSTAR